MGPIWRALAELHEKLDEIMKRLEALERPKPGRPAKADEKRIDA